MGRKAYPPGEVSGEVIGAGFRHNGKVYTAGERADLDKASAESLEAMGRFRAFASSGTQPAPDDDIPFGRGVDPPAPDDDEG